MEFSEVVGGFPIEAGRARASVPGDWLQGRTAFGGLSAALANRAMRSVLPQDWPLRELQVTFVGPVAEGPVELSASLLRAGRSAAQAEGRILSRGQVATVVLGTYGLSRPSTLAWPSPVAPTADDPERGRPLPWIPGVTPVFTQHVEMRWVEGGPPFSGAAAPKFRVLLRHREPGPVSEAHLIALADAVPPPGISVLKKPVPSSSLTWTLEMLGHDYDATPGRWWRMEAEVTAGGEGYLHQTATLVDPDGRPVALNRQLVVVYDAG